MRLVRHRKINTWPLLLCGMVLTYPAYAEDKGLVENFTGFKVNETPFMQSLGVKFGGWVDIGFAGNPHGPKNSSNAPVTFNDGANHFNLHQVYGFIEKEVNVGGKEWDVGFRADLLYGRDARFTFATNFDRTILGDDPKHQLVFPQLYASVYAPYGNGITATIGHFYTIMGYESVPSPNNFFFSRAYTMQYGEPFTHTGALLSYPVNENITIQGGVVTGWDAFFRQPANFLGGVSYTTDDERTALSATLITGSVETGGLNNDHNRTLYSIVLEHDITERLHYVLQHDHGIEQKTSASHSASWYGINQYLIYDIAANLGAGLRFEWFYDKDGARVLADGRKEHFIAITGGLNYKPIAGLTLRPEVRYDLATENNTVYRDGRKGDQVLLSISAIFHF